METRSCVTRGPETAAEGKSDAIGMAGTRLAPPLCSYRCDTLNGSLDANYAHLVDCLYCAPRFCVRGSPKWLPFRRHRSYGCRLGNAQDTEPHGADTEPRGTDRGRETDRSIR